MLVVFIMLSVYGSAVLALFLSFFPSSFLRIASYLLAGFASLSSIFVAYSLREGNGLFIAAIPLIIAAVTFLRLRGGL